MVDEHGPLQGLFKVLAEAETKESEIGRQLSSTINKEKEGTTSILMDIIKLQRVINTSISNTINSKERQIEVIKKIQNREVEFISSTANVVMDCDALLHEIEALKRFSSASPLLRTPEGKKAIENRVNAILEVIKSHQSAIASLHKFVENGLANVKAKDVELENLRKEADDVVNAINLLGGLVDLINEKREEVETHAIAEKNYATNVLEKDRTVIETALKDIQANLDRITRFLAGQTKKK